MLADDLRLAVFIAYVVLVLSRIAGSTTADSWLLLPALLAANAAIGLGEELHQRRQLRRYIEALRALDPVHRAAVIRNEGLFDVRRRLTEMLEAEGDPDTGGVVERYPFSRRDQRRNTWMYWTVVAGALLAVAWPLLAASVPRLARTLSFGLAAVLAGVLPLLRRRERWLASVIEITPFAITEEREDGTRRRLAWTVPLILRNNPRRQRLELAPAGTEEFIALDYSRLGFVRLVERVLDFGGFREPPTVQDAQTRGSAAQGPAGTTTPLAPSGPIGQPAGTVAPFWQRVQRVALHGVRTLGVAALLIAAGTTWERRAPRIGNYAALNPLPELVTPFRVSYQSRANGRGWASEGNDREVSVSPCSVDLPAWCVVERISAGERLASTDTVVLARAGLEPVYAASYDMGGVTRSRYDADSVRSEYRVADASGGVLADRRATMPRWRGGIARPVALDVLLAASRVPRDARVLIPVQPLERGSRPDVARTFEDENREIVSLLRADTAVAWYVGRDSGSVELDASASASGTVLRYRADVVTVRLPDRAITYWIADSVRVVVRRETRFRAGPTSVVAEQATSFTTAR